MNQRRYVGEAYSNNQRPRDVLLRKRNPGGIQARHREEWFQALFAPQRRGASATRYARRYIPDNWGGQRDSGGNFRDDLVADGVLVVGTGRGTTQGQ